MSERKRTNRFSHVQTQREYGRPLGRVADLFGNQFRGKRLAENDKKLRDKLTSEPTPKRILTHEHGRLLWQFSTMFSSSYRKRVLAERGKKKRDTRAESGQPRRQEVAAALCGSHPEGGAA